MNQSHCDHLSRVFALFSQMKMHVIYGSIWCALQDNRLPNRPNMFATNKQMIIDGQRPLNIYRNFNKQGVERQD